MEPKGAYYGMVQPHPIHPVVDGACLGMTERNPDDAPQDSVSTDLDEPLDDGGEPIDICTDCLHQKQSTCENQETLAECLEAERNYRNYTKPKGAFVTHVVMDETPFNATEHSIRDALRLAHAALDNHRRTRKDPIEERLQMAIDALTIAISLDLNGGVK